MGLPTAQRERLLASALLQGTQLGPLLRRHEALETW